MPSSAPRSSRPAPDGGTPARRVIGVTLEADEWKSLQDKADRHSRSLGGEVSAIVRSFLFLYHKEDADDV
jgi:hypothetical protein